MALGMLFSRRPTHSVVGIRKCECRHGQYVEGGFHRPPGASKRSPTQDQKRPYVDPVQFAIPSNKSTLSIPLKSPGLEEVSYQCVPSIKPELMQCTVPTQIERRYDCNPPWPTFMFILLCNGAGWEQLPKPA